MTVYLVRHGKDDDTVRGGWSAHGLLPAGAAQVRALAEEITAANMNIDRIYSSDLRRATETAEILSQCLECPIESILAMREANNGVLAGMKNDLANVEYPGLYWSSLGYEECYPEGESPKMFYDRINAAWTELKNKILKQADKDVLLVTHGGVIEAILCIENGLAFSNKTKHFSVPHAQLIPVEIK